MQKARTAVEIDYQGRMKKQQSVIYEELSDLSAVYSAGNSVLDIPQNTDDLAAANKARLSDARRLKKNTDEADRAMQSVNKRLLHNSGLDLIHHDSSELVLELVNKIVGSAASMEKLDDLKKLEGLLEKQKYQNNKSTQVLFKLVLDFANEEVSLNREFPETLDRMLLLANQYEMPLRGVTEFLIGTDALQNIDLDSLDRTSLVEAAKGIMPYAGEQSALMMLLTQTMAYKEMLSYFMDTKFLNFTNIDLIRSENQELSEDFKTTLAIMDDLHGLFAQSMLATQAYLFANNAGNDAELKSRIATLTAEKKEGRRVIEALEKLANPDELKKVKNRELHMKKMRKAIRHHEYSEEDNALVGNAKHKAELVKNLDLHYSLSLNDLNLQDLTLRIEKILYAEIEQYDIARELKRVYRKISDPQYTEKNPMNTDGIIERIINNARVSNTINPME